MLNTNRPGRKLATRAQIDRAAGTVPTSPNLPPDPNQAPVPSDKATLIRKLADWNGRFSPKQASDLVWKDPTIEIDDIPDIEAAVALRRLGIPDGVRRSGPRELAFAAYYLDKINDPIIFNEAISKIYMALDRRASSFLGKGDRKTRKRDAEVWATVIKMANPDATPEDISSFLPDEFVEACQELKANEDDPDYEYRISPDNNRYS